MKAKDLIREVLQERPETQEDVRALLFAVWEKQGLTPPAPEMMLKLMQPETIRRESRKIMNEEGL